MDKILNRIFAFAKPNSHYICPSVARARILKADV